MRRTLHAARAAPALAAALLLAGMGAEPAEATFDGFEAVSPPRPAPSAPFLAPDGRETSLGAFRGRTVLVNLWATWCGPCRAEMPALDALQADLGGADFAVLAVSVDTGNGDAVRRFLAETGITRLRAFRDPEARLARALGARGYPATFLIGADGRLRGRISGAHDWGRADIRSFLDARIGESAQ